ncbi:MAG: hypothetical protein ABIH23_25475, partial [bacterium]
MGLGLIVLMVYFITSVIGRRTLEPTLFSTDGSIVESGTPQDQKAALRVDQVKWHPGSILPMPIQADTRDQLYAMSHKATFRGQLTNISEEHLGRALVAVRFYGAKSGLEYGGVSVEVWNLKPGDSKPFSGSTRLYNRPGACRISIDEVHFGSEPPELAKMAEAAEEAGAAPEEGWSEFSPDSAHAPPNFVEYEESQGFSWIRFALTCLLSACLLFIAARLQILCNARIPWDQDLRLDAWASVLAIPFVTFCNVVIVLFHYVASQVPSAGPLVRIALIGLHIGLLFVIWLFFKRGLGGILLIFFFYACLYLMVFSFIR